MTDNISVPRDLLERIVGKCKLSVLGDDHAKVWELLAAPAVDVEGLEVIGFHCMDSARIETLDWRGGSYADEPLCSLPKAQAVIEQYKKDAARFRWLMEQGDDCMWMNIIRVETSDYPTIEAAIDAAMEGSKGE